MTLTLTEGTVGGASKAGLQLGGFTSTGVFVEAVLPGSEAAVEGQIQKADQLLKVNDIEIGITNHVLLVKGIHIHFLYFVMQKTWPVLKWI